jgi:hypothetical protein
MALLGTPISIHYSGKKKSKGLSIRQISIKSFDPGMVSRLVVRCWMKL